VIRYFLLGNLLFWYDGGHRIFINFLIKFIIKDRWEEEKYFVKIILGCGWYKKMNKIF
jgi:hypothetical protein